MESRSEGSPPISPADRFTDRVEDYVRCRPNYPSEVYDYLRREVGLIPGWVVADVGSGSGVFSRGLLDAGAIVYGVEPNAAMRAAAERLLAGQPGFESREGSAEATTLPDRAVDAVTAAQAFHWFRLDPARRELFRILRPGGPVILAWNRRRTEGSPFARGYEELLMRHGTDYREVDHRLTQRPQTFDAFFGPGRWRHARFVTVQALDAQGLRGRLLSSSYVPGRGQPGYEGMLEELARLFEATAANGEVRMEYDTDVYHGGLEPS